MERANVKIFDLNTYLTANKIQRKWKTLASFDL